MPKFTYQKESNNEGKDTLGDSNGGFVPNRRLTFSADDKILEKMKVGDEIEIVLKGKVTEKIDVDEDAAGSFATKSFDVNVDSYQAYPENEFTKLLDEDD